MGEYAYHHGQRIKIGSCEDLFDIRPEQVKELTTRDRHDTDVRTYVRAFLFRFPFPHEDSKQPGTFGDFRPLGVYGVEVPEGVEHRLVQFKSTTSEGHLVSLPCPLTAEAQALGVKFFKNGYPGDVQIVAQRVWEDRLVTVANCGGCGSTYRYPTLADVEPLVAAVRAYADREARRFPPDESRAKYWNTIADRILDGYRAGAAERILGFPIPAA